MDDQSPARSRHCTMPPLPCALECIHTQALGISTPSKFPFIAYRMLHRRASRFARPEPVGSCGSQTEGRSTTDRFELGWIPRVLLGTSHTHCPLCPLALNVCDSYASDLPSSVASEPIRGYRCFFSTTDAPFVSWFLERYLHPNSFYAWCLLRYHTSIRLIRPLGLTRPTWSRVPSGGITYGAIKASMYVIHAYNTKNNPTDAYLERYSNLPTAGPTSLRLYPLPLCNRLSMLSLAAAGDMARRMSLYTGVDNLVLRDFHSFLGVHLVNICTSLCVVLQSNSIHVQIASPFALSLIFG